jgi:membrane protease YdiL (CAAX protease family)
MRKQRLLENKEDEIEFFHITYILILLIFLSIFFSFIKLKFLKTSSFELEVLFSAIFTFIVELSAVLYLFFRFPYQFFLLFENKFTGFFRGILYYFLSVPFLSLLTLISFLFFKKFGIEPAPQELIFIYLQTKSIPLLIFLFILSCFFAPFFEEIIFRGFLYPAIKERFTVPISIFITSLIFSLFHHEIFVFLGIFALSLILTYLFEKTQNLWVVIGLHFANNFFANLFIFLLKSIYIIS